MNVHGYEVTDAQVEACLRRMRLDWFCNYQLVQAAEKAGVPKSVGMSYENRAPAYRLVDRLIQRERKAGNLAKVGRGWRWRADPTSEKP